MLSNDGALMEDDELFLRSLAGRFGGEEAESTYREHMAVNGQEDMSHVDTRSYIVNAFFVAELQNASRELPLSLLPSIYMLRSRPSFRAVSTAGARHESAVCLFAAP